MAFHNSSLAALLAAFLLFCTAESGRLRRTRGWNEAEEPEGEQPEFAKAPGGSQTPSGLSEVSRDASRGQEEQVDFVIIFLPNETDESIAAICKDRCSFVGHPSQGGVPFSIVETEATLQAILEEKPYGIWVIEQDVKDTVVPEVSTEVGISSVAYPRWGLDVVGVPVRPSGGRGVNIYVQDTGIRFSHTEFGGRALPTLDITRNMFMECNGLARVPWVLGELGESCDVACGRTGRECDSTAQDFVRNITFMRTLVDPLLGVGSGESCPVDGGAWSSTWTPAVGVAGEFVGKCHYQPNGGSQCAAISSSAEEFRRLCNCKVPFGCAEDEVGHGTHIAGIAGGSSYGVANEATIHSVKTVDNSGIGKRAWNIAAIDWIVTKGLKPAVIVLSLGGYGQDVAYETAINSATESGVTVVVAAGNAQEDSCSLSPAFVPQAITVGSLDSDKARPRARWSNYGSCNDIMAPGADVTTASHDDDWATNSVSGSTVSAAFVAGGVALLLEENPEWSRDTIMSHMRDFGRKDYLKGQMPFDPNLLLWVGSTMAPGTAQCPAFAKEHSPNYFGDCECPEDTFCSLDGGFSTDCPTSTGAGGEDGSEFVWTCRECQCY